MSEKMEQPSNPGRRKVLQKLATVGALGAMSVAARRDLLSGPDAEKVQDTITIVSEGAETFLHAHADRIAFDPQTGSLSVITSTEGTFNWAPGDPRINIAKIQVQMFEDYRHELDGPVIVFKYYGRENTDAQPLQEINVREHPDGGLTIDGDVK